jgi:hypothetical protein
MKKGEKLLAFIMINNKCYDMTIILFEKKMEEKTMRNDILNLTNPMEEKELEQILGGGNGVIKTISHECAMNTWQFLFTCCS